MRFWCVRREWGAGSRSMVVAGTGSTVSVQRIWGGGVTLSNRHSEGAAGFASANAGSIERRGGIAWVGGCHAPRLRGHVFGGRVALVAWHQCRTTQGSRCGSALEEHDWSQIVKRWQIRHRDRREVPIQHRFECDCARSVKILVCRNEPNCRGVALRFSSR